VVKCRRRWQNGWGGAMRGGGAESRGKDGADRHESIGGEGSTRGKREATVATTWVCGLPNDGRGKMRWGFNRGEIGLPKGPSVRLKNPHMGDIFT
jgi:hypothetical protein